MSSFSSLLVVRKVLYKTSSIAILAATCNRPIKFVKQGSFVLSWFCTFVLYSYESIASIDILVLIVHVELFFFQVSYSQSVAPTVWRRLSNFFCFPYFVAPWTFLFQNKTKLQIFCFLKKASNVQPNTKPFCMHLKQLVSPKKSFVSEVFEDFRGGNTGLKFW